MARERPAKTALDRIYRMCRVREISSSFVLMRLSSLVFQEGSHSLLDSLWVLHDRQEIVGILRGLLASNKWVLFFVISSRQPHCINRSSSAVVVIVVLVIIQLTIENSHIVSKFSYKPERGEHVDNAAAERALGIGTVHNIKEGVKARRGLTLYERWVR